MKSRARRMVYPEHSVSSTHKRIYYIWHGMISRCTKPYRQSYKNYGAKGISVCDAWIDNPTAFRDWALLNGYAPHLTIDRIDSTGNYCPENCRWIPKSEQSLNRCTQAIYTAWGETKTLTEWLNDPRCVIKDRRRITNRVSGEGWAPERAMGTWMKRNAKDYARRGEQCRQAKLTGEKVVAIKIELAAGHTLAAIAKKYGVCFQAISNIKRGKTWKHI